MWRSTGSHLVWGMWIEIRLIGRRLGILDRHTSYEVCGLKFPWSRLYRLNGRVTPRMRCVDWNIAIMVAVQVDLLVTPRMRCVDWNIDVLFCNLCMTLVTPRMRCVDWNIIIQTMQLLKTMSHLVWGVWIEIKGDGSMRCNCNCHTSYEVCGLKFPVPTIRAIIEIVTPHMGVWIEILKLCYDRITIDSHTSYEVCGLKLLLFLRRYRYYAVTPRMRCMRLDVFRSINYTMLRYFQYTS